MAARSRFKMSFSNVPALARLMTALVLFTSAAFVPIYYLQLPGRLPIFRQWADREAQYRLMLAESPGPISYDLLRAADAVLPREASVLLVTSGDDARQSEYFMFHRALYFLTPRPVWWVAGAPSDGTWEARWWISTPITPDSLEAIAAEKGATYLLLKDSALPAPEGTTVAEVGGGRLLQLASCTGPACITLPASVEPPPADLPAAWPLRLLAALAVPLALGFAVVSVIFRRGRRPAALEALALAWVLGAGVLSVAMLWLNLLGMTLKQQLVALTLLSLIALVITLYVSRFTHHVSRFTFHVSPSLPAVTWLLLILLLLNAVFVALMAIGQPLVVWDTWVNWAMKARTIFLENGLTATVYADPSRAVTLPDYPLFIPLLEAWLFAWLGAPDDRLVGVLFLLFYLALPAIVYPAARRRGLPQTWAMATAVGAAAIPQIVLLSGFAFTDAPLALLAAVAGLYVVEWLEGGPPGRLVVAAVAAGLMPWTKREGLVILAAFCLVLLLMGLKAGRSGRVARFALAAFGAAAALLAGPWWVFAAVNGVANDAFLPMTPANLIAFSGRLPAIGWLSLQSLIHPQWGFIWPVVALLCVVLILKRPRTKDQGPTIRFGLWSLVFGPQQLWLLVPALYLGVMALTYVFSGFTPFQQHVVSSIFRLIAHVALLPVFWLTNLTFPQIDTDERR